MEGPDDSQVVEQDVEKLNQGLRQRRTPDELRADLIKEEEDIQNVTATVGKPLYSRRRYRKFCSYLICG